MWIRSQSQSLGPEKNGSGDPGWILTSDLPLRRRTLYTAELRDRFKFGFWSADRGLSRFLGIVIDQGFNTMPIKFGAAAEEVEFDYK